MEIQMECVKCGKVHRHFVRRCERCGSTNVQQLGVQESSKWQSKSSKK